MYFLIFKITQKKGKTHKMGRYIPEYLNDTKNEPMTLNFVKQAIADNSILEAKVIKCDDKYNLTVALGDNIYGKISLTEYEYRTDNETTKLNSVASKVNKHIRFIPKEINQVNGTYEVTCSRKEAQKECFDNYITKLKPGDIIDARVIKIMSYGVFCDIGCGIAALLPTNNISVTHIVNASDLLKGTSKLRVIVKDTTNPFKIQLSHKELLGTWEQEAAKFNEGDIVPGMVLSVEDYGIFVRISQNLSGLAEPTALTVNPGDIVSVQVLNIKSDNMKVRLYITEKIEFSSPAEEIEEKKLKFKYYITDNRITEWVYSTPNSKKLIKSVFTE